MAFSCKTGIKSCTACSVANSEKIVDHQDVNMGSDKVTAALKTFIKGILHDNLDKVEQSMKYVRLDEEINTDLIYSLSAGKDGDVDNLNVPRVPKLFPLHLACTCGNGDVVRLLLKNGADCNLVLDDGETALHFACLYGSVECVRELVSTGCNVNQETRGDTPLMLTTACYGTSGISMKTNYLEIAEILINNDCDVNIPDSQGLTPLHLAAGKEDPELLKLLIRSGVDVNVKAKATIHPNTPLIGAVSAELEENVQLLLSAGSNVNQVVYPGVTALSTALDNNALGIVLDLLLSGADPKLRVDTLNIQMFLGNKNYLLVLLLLAYGLNVNWQNSYDRASILLTATRKECLPVVQWLLLQGADPDLDNCLGTTPIWTAVKLDSLHLTTLLLRWNCDLDVSSLECNPLIPIVPVQLALQLGHFELAKLLLHFGCLFKSNWKRFTAPIPLMTEAWEFKKWLVRWCATPISLQHACMLLIRGTIGPGLPRKVRSLKIPSKLKTYIIKGYL